MDRPVRVALAEVDDGRLLERLRALPLQPEAEAHGDLYGSIGVLTAQPPDVLLLGAHPDDADLPGALRLLRSLLPGMAIVLVAAAAHELELGPVCARAQAQQLLLPCTDGELAAALDRALTGSDRPTEGTFVDLARGVADAVNSPLLAVTGHLQLLLLQLDPQREAGLRPALEAALAGAVRIQHVVDQVHLAARAADGPRRRERIDLRELLQRAAEALPVAVDPEDDAFAVRGDPEVLHPAVAGFTRFARELQELGCRVQLSLSRCRAGALLRLRVESPTLPALPHWRLPRTFEPYYLNRLLRGSGNGLALFLAQAAVHGHGGQATARRLPDGSLAFDLALPTV